MPASRIFSGGADFAGFASVSDTEDIAAAGREFFTALAQVPVVVIGALNGPAVGAGAMIAAQCDLLISVPDAYLQVPELVNGYLGGARHVKRLATYHKVLRMMLLGERLTAEEALATGVILELVAAAEPDRARLRDRRSDRRARSANGGGLAADHAGAGDGHRPGRLPRGARSHARAHRQARVYILIPTGRYVVRSKS